MCIHRAESQPCAGKRKVLFFFFFFPLKKGLRLDSCYISRFALERPRIKFPAKPAHCAAVPVPCHAANVAAFPTERQMPMKCAVEIEISYCDDVVKHTISSIFFFFSEQKGKKRKLRHLFEGLFL